MPYLYLIVNLAAISIPLIFSFHPKLRFYKEWYRFWPANIITGVVFIAWDVWFTKMGVWGFNPTYLTGHYLLNLPVEEVLFFVCIPYACIYSYHCFKVFRAYRLMPFSLVIPTIGLAVILFIIAGVFYQHIYTTITFTLAGLLLLISLWYNQERFNTFVLSYVVMLIPFAIVNGILTGYLTPNPVVWYNDAENLGIRLGSIPLDDTMYMLALLLMHFLIYEKWPRKK